MMRTKDEHIDYLEDEVQYLEGRKEELKEKVRHLEEKKNFKLLGGMSLPKIHLLIKI